jgi:hypothetical protein
MIAAETLRSHGVQQAEMVVDSQRKDYRNLLTAAAQQFQCSVI